MNYFNLFEIEQKYNINVKDLNKKYLVMLSKHHPDIAKNNEEKSKNLNISIDINKGYEILKDDIERAKYLLNLNNIHFEDLEFRNKLSIQQLENILEDREYLQKTIDPENLKNFYDEKILEKDNLIKLLDEVFDNKKLDEAVDIVIKLKYLAKLLDETKIKIKNGNN